jgi:Putative transposase DNA-binding domain
VADISKFTQNIAKSIPYNSNVLRTDGVDLDFIFDKRSLPARELQTPASFRNWIEFGDHRTTVWGVDPGVTDVFVAVDGHGEDQHRVRRTSSKEYYHICGFNKATEQRRRWRVADGQNWNQLIEQMPTVKTTNIGHFLDAIRYRFDNFFAIVEHYDRNFRYRRLAFSSYRNRQRGIHEICRRLTFGSKKYGSQPAPHHANRTRDGDFWRPASPLDRPYEDAFHHYIIAFGNGCFGNMRGKRSGPTKKIYKHLCHLSRLPNRHISVIKIDEYLTSKVCAGCDQRRVRNLRERRDFAGKTGPNIHALLNCQNCGKVWNRDQMAAKNIRYIFDHMATNTNERPLIFQRP